MINYDDENDCCQAAAAAFLASLKLSWGLERAKPVHCNVVMITITIIIIITIMVMAFMAVLEGI